MHGWAAEVWWEAALRGFAGLVLAVIALAADASHSPLLASLLGAVWLLSLQAILRGVRLVGLGCGGA